MVGNGGRSRRPAPVAAVSCGYESPDESQANINLGPRTVSSPAVLPQRRPGYYANASPALMEEGEENSAAHASLNDLVLKARNMRKVGIRDRIACIQWTWFTMTMVCRPSLRVLEITLVNIDSRLPEALRMSSLAVCSNVLFMIWSISPG